MTCTRKKIEGFSYGLGEVIGKGYSSHVYRGRNDTTGESVAVKVIDLRMLKNDINRVLLESEIEVLQELKDLSHILSLEEVYTTKNNTYIITELCDSDLTKIAKGKLEEPQAIRLMEQILTGYQQFASRDIIHRDLKPANILVAQGLLKIADFGFAIKAVDAHKSSRYNVGSPLYMAPQSLKRNQYSLQTDIWALGVIFFELLTGQTPWRAKNERQLLKRIEQQPIQGLLPTLSISSQALLFLQRTLVPDPAKRMELQQLTSFSFRPQELTLRTAPRALTQKKLNIEERKIVKCDRQRSALKPDWQPTTPKPDRRLIDRSCENRGASRQQSLHKFQSFKQEAPKQPIKIQINKSVQLRENPEEGGLRAQRKGVSRVLVAQIHFCRFLFKLLGRIGESARKGLLRDSAEEVKSITREYSSIIKRKIEDLSGFASINFLNTPHYDNYKQSTDFPKLIKIAKEYQQRYSQQLKDFWGIVGQNQTQDKERGTEELIGHLYNLLRNREQDEGFIYECKRQIIVLDYLITTKQLIELIGQGNNYDRFARKSRIEEIVEGKTSDISMELYLKIMGRARQVAQLH